VIGYYDLIRLLSTYLPRKLHQKWTFYDRITQLSQNQNKWKTTPLKEFQYFLTTVSETQKLSKLWTCRKSALYREELTIKLSTPLTTESRLLIKSNNFFFKAAIATKEK
jgi:hypothetical protein